MAKLILSDAAGKVQEFVLEKERTSIGRHPENDLALNDKSVSGQHAVVVSVLSEAFIEDLDSTNGTLVNGRQVAKHPLSDGDTITIGRNTLRFENPAAISEEELERTMILRPSQVQAAMGSPAQATEAPSVGKLEVLSGPNGGRQLELTKALTTLGKPGVQVAAITRRADGYYIVHVSGDPRPQVNGAPIDAIARRLDSGDEIELAGTRMRFTLA